ncbi:MAG: hypothetical protein HON90_10820 [Halobacteriovoraceae bacterium]|jgi:hypothetical protein|nr:hypothetical protein [Halobacteriovoraceae bacterium]
MKLYSLSKLRIADTIFHNVHVLGIDFSPIIEQGFPKDIKFIAGYNIITKKNWYFDYINKLWAVDDI